MGLISRKNIKRFRQFILWPNLEFALLLEYIACFAWIISIKQSTMDGSGLRLDKDVMSSANVFHGDF